MIRTSVDQTVVETELQLSYTGGECLYFATQMAWCSRVCSCTKPTCTPNNGCACDAGHYGSAYYLLQQVSPSKYVNGLLQLTERQVCLATCNQFRKS